MLIVPRWYQEEAVLALWDYFRHNTGNPIIALPTGTGKSLVIAEFLRGVFHYYPRTRVIVATHVKELIEQNFQELLNIWPTAPVGIYSAGLGRKDLGRPIVFGGIASMVKKPEAFGFIDFVIVDECHLVSHKEDTNYHRFFDGLKKINPALKVIGLSATPYRLGQGLLTDDGLFTDVAYDCTSMDKFNRLVAEGYISPLIPKRTNGQLDVSGVHLVGGDYNKKELQRAVDKFEITYQCCLEMIQLGQNRKHWLVFASGVEHAEHITEILNDLDIPSVAIHSKMNTDRDDAISGFKSGKYRCAVNNNVLTTGFNFKPIDLIGVFRPTQSPNLWVQLLGRGTRPAPGKENCLVLDFAGNTARLGPINDPVIPGKPGKKGSGAAPVKICPTCGTYNHTSVRICICCGGEFPKEEKLVAVASNEELIAGDAPVVEVFKVTKVTYRENAREGKTPSLKVTYHCGQFQQFSEWVCLEHQGFAGKKARDWWRKRHEYDPPKTIKEALPMVDDLAQPKHVRVWVNRKYPEVLGYDFEGTAFEANAPKTEFIPF